MFITVLIKFLDGNRKIDRNDSLYYISRHTNDM